MNSFNSLPVNELHYGNVVERVPIIPVSVNGVHYNPLVPKRSTFASLGRGDEGRAAATKFQVEALTKILERHNWAVPDKIDTPNAHADVVANHLSALQVGWFHPVFGHVSAQLLLRPNRGAEAAVRLHPLVAFLARRVVEPNRHRDDVYTTIVGTEQAAKTFRADPLGTILTPDKLGVPAAAFLDVLNPPPLQNLTFKASGLPRDDGLAWTRQTNHADLYGDEDVAKAAAIKGLPILERALAAFRAMGVQVSANFTYINDNRLMRSLNVTVPPNLDVKGQEHMHQLSISESGISVECGYVKSDQLYSQWQMRNAKKFLEEIQEYEEMSFVIERPETKETDDQTVD